MKFSLRAASTLLSLALVAVVATLLLAGPTTGPVAEDLARPVASSSLGALADVTDGATIAPASEGSLDGAASTPLRVVGAVLIGSDSWTTWFGAAPTRTLVLTLENTGRTTIADIPVALEVGRSANPTTNVAIPSLGTLGPGEKRRYEVPVTFPAFAFGSYSAAGQIAVQGEPLTFVASTSSYPWALIVLPLVVVLEVVLLRGRNRLRRAIQESSTRSRETTSPPVLDEARIHVDALVDAAIAGAFSAADPSTEREPRRPRQASPIDVRPIVSAIVGGRAVPNRSPWQ